MGTTQHRPQRESEARERADLKRENRTLRKQLLRMRRQLQKMVESQSTVERDASDFAEPLTIKTPGCEACGAGPGKLTRVMVPSGTLVVCRECHHRKKETK